MSCLPRTGRLIHETIVEFEPCTIVLTERSHIYTYKRDKVIVSFANTNIRLNIDLFLPTNIYYIVSVAILSDNEIESLFRFNIVEIEPNTK